MAVIDEAIINLNCYKMRMTFDLITHQVLSEVREKRDEKKKVLEEQLQIIQGEKQKVDQDVQEVLDPDRLGVVNETSLERKKVRDFQWSSPAGEDPSPTQTLATGRSRTQAHLHVSQNIETPRFARICSLPATGSTHTSKTDMPSGNLTDLNS